MADYVSNKSKAYQMGILEQFFGECLRFWERTLGVDSDLSQEPFINAMKEIPKYNPYKVQGELLDPDVVADFRRYRYMDCYGRDYWQQHLRADYPDEFKKWQESQQER